jgi:prepilin-type N-terminal cleavage/methylation domain-containing protein
MSNNSKGFTLIEMLIVIAVIGILAGIVLTGVRGFQASARDTKRIGDIRNTQNLAELYFTRNGTYPADLADLATVGTVPVAPPGAAAYAYATDAAQLTYCLTAELEEDNSAAVNDSGGGVCPGNCGDPNVFCSASE